MSQPGAPQTIVFFDGLCHLCNGFVDFVLSRDTKRRLVFAPLQGETAKKVLTEHDRASLSTVVVRDGDRVFRESAAILRVFKKLGGGWAAAGFFLGIVPGFLRDVVYRAVARNRYEWFGERDVCRLPQPHERDRLLD